MRLAPVIAGLSALMLTALSASAHADIWFVNRAAVSMAPDGKSWQRAFPTLQQGIAAAQNGDSVWVAQGYYTPVDNQTDKADREASIAMKKGVILYGGFRGNERSLDDRDWKLNKTILTGEIGNLTVKEDNSYHVLMGVSRTTMDGFIVTSGYADGVGGQHSDQGGGLLAVNASPSFRNVTFRDNFAMEGGAVYAEGRSQVRFDKVTFLQNRASRLGGAIMSHGISHPTMKTVRFLANAAGLEGGAVFATNKSSPKLTDCLLAFNASGAKGGAISVRNGSSPQLNNCTISYNHAVDTGGALYAGPYEAGRRANKPIVRNSILWSNSTEGPGAKDLGTWGESEVSLSYTLLHDVYPGQYVTYGDPGFRNPREGDFRLKKGALAATAGVRKIAIGAQEALEP